KMEPHPSNSPSLPIDRKKLLASQSGDAYLIISIYFDLQPMKKPKLLNQIAGLIAAALIVAPWLLAVSASEGAIHRVEPNPRRITLLEYLPVFSDLDGDRKIDRAELTSKGQYKNIQIDFSNSPSISLTFDTGILDRGKLVSGDIDNDNDEDLIWISQSQPKKLIFWLSDGHGNFTLAKEPPPDTQKVNALLGKDSESKLFGEAGILELPIAVLPSDSTELEWPKQPVILAFSTTPFEQNEEHTLSALFLSVLRKRGPPTSLS